MRKIELYFDTVTHTHGTSTTVTTHREGHPEVPLCGEPHMGPLSQIGRHVEQQSRPGGGLPLARQNQRT